MSQAVAIDILSLIRHESQRASQHQPPHCLIQRYQIPEYYYPPHLRHPNQPFSSPSSVSSSPSSSSSAISVDGEFDVRIDMILQSPEKNVKAPTSNVIAGACERASAPPLSDDEIEQIEHNFQQQQDQQQQDQQQQQQQQQQEKEEEKEEEEEVCVCVICYETFEEPVELIRGRNYTSEELEEIEGSVKITNFCQTCKYNLHHRCLDEYRLTKMTDILRNSYQRGYIQSPDIAGTFGMKCLLCSKEVEKIHISMDGEVNIVKTQPGANEQQQQEQQQQEQQQQQQQIEEIMRNRMQRRLRRRQRIQFCKNKICTICLMFLVAITLLVFVFRVI